MNAFVDIQGRRVGKLTVRKLDRKAVTPSGTEFFWECVCDCGVVKTIAGRALKSKHGTRSCGCSRRNPRTHGYCQNRKSEEFRINRVWSEMIQRCTNPNCSRFEYYGERGIKVCKQWQGVNGFTRFISDMGPRPAGFSLERKNNNKNYTPSNCCWASKSDQARNTRQNVNIEYEGKTQCLKDWSVELGIAYKTLHLRIRRYNWTIDRAFTTPVLKRNRNAG